MRSFFNVELLTGLNDGITNDIDRRDPHQNFFDTVSAL